MPRSIWTGAISFGLVSIPVGLFSAVEEKTVRFHQLERGTSDRIRYKKVNERTGDEVASEDIVKGYEVGTDRYIVLTSSELEAAEPSATRSVEIEDFVEAAEIDPIYYDRTYYLAPKDAAASRPYGLLLEAMRASDKVGIATFVMRGKEHLAAIRVDKDGQLLVLETMFFSDEIRDPKEALGSGTSAEAPKERELNAATSLIESMGAEFEPSRYRDRYRDRVMELIEAKRAGEEVVVGERPASASNVVDLMEALRRSVEQVQGGRTRPDGVGTEGQELPTARRGKREAAAPAANGRPAGQKKAPSTAKKASSEQLSMLSKEELYQLAQSLEVAGRSKMSRNELELAVARAKPQEERSSEAPARRGARRAS
ncbi:MAG: Ku protein [Acidimicrobiales bacterium]